VYAQTAHYDFAYDDLQVIRDRPQFHSLANWREILTASWWPARNLYRPLTALTLAVNWAAGGGSASAFHLTNIILHAIASVLVYLLARELIGAAGAAVAGLLFAVHPVHVEAVANLVGRAEVLATIFVVAAVLVYRLDGRLADRGDASSWRRYATAFGTLAATALALASKESAFALPALLLLVDWLDSSQQGKRGLGVDRHWVLWLGAVGVAFAWLLWRSTVVGDLTGREVAPGLEDKGLIGRTVTMLPVILQYGRLLFTPARLSADYSPNFLVLGSGLTLAGLAGILTLIIAVSAAWLGRRRFPVITFALGWIGATVLIVANVLVPTGVILAERTLYLPSVGAVLVLGAIGRSVYARWRRPALIGVAVLVAAGAARTVTRNPVWRDNQTLFPQIIRDAPGSSHGAWIAGGLAEERGDLREAERMFRRSLAINPLAWNAWRDLGRVLEKQGRYREASEKWWAAWQLNNDALLTAQRSILVTLRVGRVDTAAARVAIAQAARPLSWQLWLAAAEVALAQGNPLRAMTLARQAAWQFPDSVRFWGLTAAAALDARQCAQLTRSLDRLHALQADSARVAPLERGARKLGCS
jgi:hypothetical protein